MTAFRNAGIWHAIVHFDQYWHVVPQIEAFSTLSTTKTVSIKDESISAGVMECWNLKIGNRITYLGSSGV